MAWARLIAAPLATGRRKGTLRHGIRAAASAASWCLRRAGCGVPGSPPTLRPPPRAASAPGCLVMRDGDPGQSVQAQYDPHRVIQFAHAVQRRPHRSGRGAVIGHQQRRYPEPPPGVSVVPGIAAALARARTFAEPVSRDGASPAHR